MALPKGTEVTLFGLTARDDLNRRSGVIHDDWDGARYSVRLSDGAVVPVGVDNLAPVDVDAFVHMQRRLSYELHVFSNHYSNRSKASLFPVEMKCVHPMGKAIMSTTTRIELCTPKADGEKGIFLRLFSGDDAEPYAQLLPDNKDSSVDGPDVSVYDFDSVTAIGCDVATIVKASHFRVLCFNEAFVFGNRYPLFHLTLDKMLLLTTARVSPFVSANTMDIVRYHNKRVSSLYYCAEERMVLFHTPERTHRVISFQWQPYALVVARGVHATNHKMRVLASFERRDALMTPPPALPSVVVRVVSTVPETFLGSQVTLVSHMYQFMERKFRVQQSSSELPSHLVLYGEMLSSMHTVLRYIPRIPNETSAGEDFRPSYPFMESVSTNTVQYLSWLANMESLACAFTIMCSHPSDAELLMEHDGNVCVIRALSEVVRVAHFGMDPRVMQEIVLKMQVDNARTMTTPLVDMPIEQAHGCDVQEGIMSMILNNCFSVDDESVLPMMERKSEAGETSKKGENFEDAERLRIANELVADEEREKSEKKKKKKKSRKKKPASAPPPQAIDPSSSSPPTPPLSAFGESSDDEEEARDLPIAATSRCSPSSAESQYTIVQSKTAKSLRRKLEGERNTLTERLEQVVRERDGLALERDDMASAHEKAVEAYTAKISALESTVRRVNDEREQIAAEKQTLVDDVQTTKEQLLKTREELGRLKTKTERTRRDHAKKRELENTIAEAREFERTARMETDALRLEKGAVESRLSTIEKQIVDQKRQLMEKLRTQLLFYLKGHYMKLSPTTLSINAVLRDGFVVKNTIEFYRSFDLSVSESDVLHKLPEVFGDVLIEGDGLTFV